MIGEVVGNYRIMDKIATGGMGVVYRAEHTLIGKKAAIKLLKKQFCENRDVIDRFFNEARGTTSVRHSGIVDIYDFGYYQDDRAYIVMEFLEGETLKERLGSGEVVMSPEDAIRIIHNVAGAVGAAHDNGIIHRDLKPDNIFLVPDPDMPGGERVKVLDFGLAKLTEQQSVSMGTQTGIVLGTPTYMAPEQCDGMGNIDHRADQYALGCILYQAVCGRPPFSSQRPFALLQAHQFEQPAAPRSLNATLPAELEQVILALLAKRPDDRYRDMDALRAALDHCVARVDDSADTLTYSNTSAVSGDLAGHGRAISISGDGNPAPWGAPAGRVPSAFPAPAGGPHVPDSGAHASMMSHAAAAMIRPPSLSGVDGGAGSRVPIWLWVLGGLLSILIGVGIVYAVTHFTGGEPQTIIAVSDDEAVVDGGASQIERDAETERPLGRDGGVTSAADDELIEFEADEAAVVDAGEEAAEEASEEDGAAADEGAGAAGGDDDGAGADIAHVTVWVKTPSAVVKVDGAVRSDSPLLLSERERPYRLDISAPGHRSKSMWVRVDKDRVINVALERKPARIDL
ncbi:MAG: hypothetical protein Tsb0020_12420 [Haliangiales bacterium]